MFQRFRIADAFSGLERLKPGTLDRASQSGNEGSLFQTGQGVSSNRYRTRGRYCSAVRPNRGVAGASRSLDSRRSSPLRVLVACSNIASLLVARGAKRRNELAIRAALGAGRWRLVWQLATESILLSLVGGIGGVVLAYAGLHSLLALAPADLPRSDGIGINGVVLGFSFGLCLLTGLVFGLLPASKVARIQAGSALQEQGRGISAGPGARRIRGILVATQYAVAIVLLTGAGLLIRSFQLLNLADRVFDTLSLLTVSVPLPYEKYKQPARGQAFFDEAIQRLDSIPGVQGAATGSAVFDTFQGNVPERKYRRGG